MSSAPIEAENNNRADECYDYRSTHRSGHSTNDCSHSQQEHNQYASEIRHDGPSCDWIGFFEFPLHGRNIQIGPPVTKDELGNLLPGTHQKYERPRCELRTIREIEDVFLGSIGETGVALEKQRGLPSELYGD